MPQSLVELLGPVVFRSAVDKAGGELGGVEMANGSRSSRVLKAVGIVALLGLVAMPYAGARPERKFPAGMLQQLSSGPATRYFIAHPSQAPAAAREGFQTLRNLSGRVTGSTGARALGSGPMQGQRFNADAVGLPQNEESVGRCASRPNVVLGGTNDYRGLLDPEENFTGWHFSSDGGRTLDNEGLLPSINFNGTTRVPSGGDPVDFADNSCNLYSASLNYDPADLFPNGIGLYKTTPKRLASCPGGANPSCWPQRKLVAKSPGPAHFYDKEWMYVGHSGSAGKVVWVTYSDFTTTGPGPTDFTASVFAVRCDGDLSPCTKPIKISGSDKDIQFSDVTVGPDGRTYITWSQIKGEIEGTPQTFIHKLRVAPAGSTTFGPTRTVAVERNAIPFGGALHANDFRIATYPKSEVKMVNGKPRVYVVWDACRARPLDTICEEPAIKLRYSDNRGASWSRTKILTAGGDNYFPTISANKGGRNLAVAWFTNRFDPVFHNRQDVGLVTMAPNGTVVNRQRLTSPSNETEADPFLGGFFIGDYIEVHARHNQALVHYNANYRSIKLHFPDPAGFPVPQQDNYLARRGL